MKKEEFIEELKDIKKELGQFAYGIMKNGVNEELKFFDNYEEFIALNGYAMAIAIIDKHIADIAESEEE